MVRLAVACWSVFVLAGCVRMDPRAEGRSERAVVPTLQVYTLDGEVSFVLQITNVGAGPIEWHFDSGQSFDFLVERGDRLVWRWSDGRSFTQARRAERLDEGESVRYEAVWEPAAEVSGEYLVTGILTARDHRVEQTTRIVLP